VSDESPLTLHQLERERFEAERARQDSIAARYSMVQLGLFGLSVVLAGSGLFGGPSRPLLLAGLGAFVVFLVVRAFQGRVITRRDRAEVRRDVNDLQVRRMLGRFDEVPPPGAALPPVMSRSPA